MAETGHRHTWVKVNWYENKYRCTGCGKYKTETYVKAAKRKEKKDG